MALTLWVTQSSYGGPPYESAVWGKVVGIPHTYL